MGDIIIEEANYKSFALVLANLFLFIASIAIYIFGLVEHKKRYWLSALLIAFILLVSLIYLISKAAKVKSLLTITRDGIIDNSSLGAMGFISFDDIKGFEIVSLYNSRVIGVIPKDLEVFLAKLPVTKRRIVKRNIFMQQPPVSINVDMAKDMVLEDIYTLLQKRLSDYSRLYE